MKKFIFCLLLASVFTASSAQSDILYLKNGSVLVGKFKQKVNDSVYVFELQGNTVSFNQHLVIRLETNAVSFQIKGDPMPVHPTYKKGYYLGASAGYSLALDKGPQQILSLHALPGYRFGLAYVQLRVGADINPGDSKGSMLFWNLYNLGMDVGIESSGSIRPYAGLGLGASFGYAKSDATNQSMNGGINARFDTGIRMDLGRNSELGLGLALQMYSLKYKTIPGFWGGNSVQSTEMFFLGGPTVTYKSNF